MRTFFSGARFSPELVAIHADKPTRSVPVPSIICLPMLQHRGTPAEPVVKVGDEVLVGQIIGRRQGHTSAHIHATVSGVVVDVSDVEDPFTGKKVRAVFLRSDGKDRPHSIMTVCGDYRNLSREHLIDILEERGIVELGSEGYPLNSLFDRESTGTLLISVILSEPLVDGNIRYAMEKIDELAEGIEILKKIFEPSLTVVAIDSSYTKGVEVLGRLADVARTIVVNPPYPRGLPEYFPSYLKLEKKTVVIDCLTAIAVAEAVSSGRPQIERVVRIDGPLAKEPGDYRVRIGTRLLDLVASAGGLKNEPELIVMNGPLRGTGLYKSETPVTKRTRAISFFGKKSINLRESWPCIRCGDCLEVCPERLNPCEVGRFVERKMYESCIEYEIESCTSCGLCAFVCPSKRPLTTYFNMARIHLARGKRKNNE